nr:cinnamoyl-CoA reductase 1-like isoform X2 [Lolium perenne]
METSSPPLPRVCVTGGGGFIGSCLVKLLLTRGYAVNATVRDPRDAKNAFLMQLDGAPENLQLIKADMLDYDTVAAAFAGCEGVFHVATPVPEQKMVDPQAKMMDPAVKGTTNVLKACSAKKVQKLILVSSIAASCFTLDWPQDKIKDESCWSDKELCRENENWYSLAKTMAEEMALEYGLKNGLHVATVLPGLVLGPLLQHVAINTTSKVLIYILKGGPDTMNNKFYPIVDVRDVADALLLLYDKAGRSERYICSLDEMDLKDLLGILKSMYPNYSYADKMVDVDYKVEVTSDKLKNLGWKPRKLEETLADSIKSYEKTGLLHGSDGEHCRLPYLYCMPPILE